MKDQFFEAYLTKQEAERLTFSLPLGYSLLSTEMIRKPLKPDPELHIEIILNEQILSRQKHSKINISPEQNLIINDILNLFQMHNWRFQIIEEILTKNNQNYTSFAQIKIKSLQKRYRNFSSFYADLSHSIYNTRLKQMNWDYKQQSNYFCKMMDNLKSYYKLNQEEYNTQRTDNSKQLSQSYEVKFSKQQLKQLQGILPQLHQKYFRNIGNIIGQNNIQKRKDDSQYLDIGRLSTEDKHKLLKYARICRNEQTNSQLTFKIEHHNSQSSFMSSENDSD